jgi:hypothetical protein
MGMLPTRLLGFEVKMTLVALTAMPQGELNTASTTGFAPPPALVVVAEAEPLDEADVAPPPAPLVVDVTSGAQLDAMSPSDAHATREKR